MVAKKSIPAPNAPAYVEDGLDAEAILEDAAPSAPERMSLLDSLEINKKWRGNDHTQRRLRQLEMSVHASNVALDLLLADLLNGCNEDGERMNDYMRGGLFESIRLANDRIAELVEQLQRQAGML